MKKPPKDRLAEECWIPDPVIEPLAIKLFDLFSAERAQYVPDAPPIRREKHMPTFRKAAAICQAQSMEPERFIQVQVAALAQIGKIYPNGLLSCSIAEQRGISVASSIADEVALYRAQLILLARVEEVFGRANALGDADLQISPALRCWAAHRAGLDHVTLSWIPDADAQMHRSTIAAQLFTRKDFP